MERTLAIDIMDACGENLSRPVKTQNLLRQAINTILVAK